MRRILGGFTIFFTALSGCARAQIVSELTSHVPDAPFHRVLVCSFGSDSKSAQQLEGLIVARLRKHKVQTESCFKVLDSSETAQEWTDKITSRFDAILITRREPRPQPNPQDVRGLESVLLSPRVGTAPPPTAAEKQQDFPKPNTIAEFVRHYDVVRNRYAIAAQTATNRSSEETILTPYGEQRYIYGATDLLSTRQDRIVWSLGGYVASGKSSSMSKIMHALAKRLVNELSNNDLIP